MQLLNLFTVAGSAGDSFHTNWLPLPQDYDRVEFWVMCKMFDGTQIDVVLLSSMDQDENTQETLSTQNVTGTGTTVAEVTADVGAFVRLKLGVTTGATRGVLSVWVVPKRA